MTSFLALRDMNIGNSFSGPFFPISNRSWEKTKKFALYRSFSRWRYSFTSLAGLSSMLSDFLWSLVLSSLLFPALSLITLSFAIRSRLSVTGIFVFLCLRPFPLWLGKGRLLSWYGRFSTLDLLYILIDSLSLLDQFDPELYLTSSLGSPSLLGDEYSPGDGTESSRDRFGFLICPRLKDLCSSRAMVCGSSVRRWFSSSGWKARDSSSLISSATWSCAGYAGFSRSTSSRCEGLTSSMLLCIIKSDTK